MSISWDVPAEWGMKKLGDIAPENSTQIKPSEFAGQTFNYWGLDAINKGVFEEPAPNFVRGEKVSSTCIKFDASHVLYAKLRPYLNKVIVPSIEGIGSTEWVPLKPDTTKLDRHFLAYVLRTSRFVHYAELNSTGARMPQVRKSALWEANIPVPFPDDPEQSLVEQQRIVARIEALLAEVREMRELHGEITADTDKLLTAFLKETFDDLRQDYDLGKVGDENLCEVIPGQHILSRDYTDSPPGIPYITGPADFGYKYPEVSRWTTEPKVLAQPGDILFTVKGSGVGKTNCAPIDEKCAIGRQIMAIRVNQATLLTDYLFYNLLGRFDEFQRLRQGAAIPGIRKDHVQAIDLPVPPIPIQEQVISRLTTINAEIEGIEEANSKNRKHLIDIEQTILGQAFRGEL